MELFAEITELAFCYGSPLRPVLFEILSNIIVLNIFIYRIEGVYQVRSHIYYYVLESLRWMKCKFKAKLVLEILELLDVYLRGHV